MKRMVWVTTVCLLLVVMVTAYINSADLAAKREIQEKALVTIKGGDVEVQMDLETIRGLGEQTFTATIRSSSSPNRDHTYTGVALKDVLAEAGLTIEASNQVVVKAIDGYVVALMGNEVLDEENVYLVYLLDGQPLGTKEEGGSGPYQTIIRKDPFSQRWCKFVAEIEVR